MEKSISILKNFNMKGVTIIILLFCPNLKTSIQAESVPSIPTRSTKLICVYRHYETDILKIHHLFSNASTLCADFVVQVSSDKQKGFTITDMTSLYVIQHEIGNGNLLIEGFYYPYWSETINDVVIQQLRLYYLHGIVLYISLEDLAKDKNKLANTEAFLRGFTNAINQEAKISGKSKLTLGLWFYKNNKGIRDKINISSIVQNADWLIVENNNMNEPADHLKALRYVKKNSLPENENYLLYSDDNIINYFLDQGANPERLIYYLLSWGFKFTLLEPQKMYALTDEFRKRLNFDEICTKLQKEPDWTVEYMNESAAGTYMHRGNEWIAYQDTTSTKIKAKRVVDKHLGGMCIEIWNDDHDRKCGDKMLPLTEAAKEAATIACETCSGDFLCKEEYFPKL